MFDYLAFQVDKMFDYLVENQKVLETELHLQFVVTCGASNRGIYLRESKDACRAHDVAVTIEPRFREDTIGTV